MYDKARTVLSRCINGLIAVFLFVFSVVYVGVASILMTAVINALRLDTYVGIETGVAVVLLVLFLGWVPLWLFRSLGPRA